MVFWAESEDPGPHVNDFHRPLSLESTRRLFVWVCFYEMRKVIEKYD